MMAYVSVSWRYRTSGQSLIVLQGSDLQYEVELPGPPAVLELFCNDGGEQGDEVVYGTSDGRIGLVQVTRWELKLRLFLRNRLILSIVGFHLFIANISYSRWINERTVQLSLIELLTGSQCNFLAQYIALLCTI